ncbi:MAG: hypothetical protein LBB38_01335 [Puniceicoccales bacterium]|jgi:hypothetical protein|nr:hypothetical protein [Puniceicoccales bacterium]
MDQYKFNLPAVVEHFSGVAGAFSGGRDLGNREVVALLSAKWVKTKQLAAEVCKLYAARDVKLGVSHVKNPGQWLLEAAQTPILGFGSNECAAYAILRYVRIVQPLEYMSLLLMLIMGRQFTLTIQSESDGGSDRRYELHITLPHAVEAATAVLIGTPSCPSPVNRLAVMAIHEAIVRGIVAAVPEHFVVAWRAIYFSYCIQCGVSSHDILDAAIRLRSLPFNGEITAAVRKICDGEQSQHPIAMSVMVDIFHIDAVVADGILAACDSVIGRLFAAAITPFISYGKIGQIVDSDIKWMTVAPVGKEERAIDNSCVAVAIFPHFYSKLCDDAVELARGFSKTPFDCSCIDIFLCETSLHSGNGSGLCKSISGDLVCSKCWDSPTNGVVAILPNAGIASFNFAMNNRERMEFARSLVGHIAPRQSKTYITYSMDEVPHASLAEVGVTADGIVKIYWTDGEVEIEKGTGRLIGPYAIAIAFAANSGKATGFSRALSCGEELISLAPAAIQGVPALRTRLTFARPFSVAIADS